MKSILLLISSLGILYINIFAQDTTQACKVASIELIGKYKGGCKKGLANGQGEAKGLYTYTGSFKNGMPNGEGTYYYIDSSYYVGNFQDGIKEGKGEFHYPRNGMPDSIINGYWSGNEYTGKTYITYKTDADLKFDNVDITPSENSGKTLTIEIATTSGSPDGTVTNSGGTSGFSLYTNGLISMNGDDPRLLLKDATAFKSTATFELHKYPAKLQLVLSDGSIVSLELYKAADWTARFYLNR
jgi:hypothetical protein